MESWKRFGDRPWLFAALFGAVAIWRLICCLELPANTGDVLRHALYGLEAGKRGLAAADLPLEALSPAYGGVSWSRMPFNYPVCTLLFDIAVMRLLPTLLGLKLALTLLELGAAALIYRHTGERWLALAYWASPVSVWWISHEGQFEALQNFLLIAAVTVLPGRRRWAWMLLALAIQTKVFAVFLLPWFLLASFRQKSLVRDLAFFALGFLPTVAAALFYSPLAHVGLSRVLRYNPYHWNVFAREIFLWNPTWLIACNQLSSYGAVALCLWHLGRSRAKAAWLAPLAFLATLKAWVHGQFWYMAVMPSLLLPIEDRRWRLALFLLVPLLDVRSLVELVWGPFGYQIEGFGALTTLTDLSTL